MRRTIISHYFARIERGNYCPDTPYGDKEHYHGEKGCFTPFSDYCEMIIAHDIAMNDVLNELIKYGDQAHWRSIELMAASICPRTQCTVPFTMSTALILQEAKKTYFPRSVRISEEYKEGITS